MASSQNILGLEWLVSEVEASLQEACGALEGYSKGHGGGRARDSAKDKAEDGQLRICLDYIHQVTGSLKISQCYGGALFSEEMEALVDALLNGTTVNTSEALEVLGEAVVALPNYLRECIASGLDQPAFLLTLLNELRASRNEPLASSSQFFKPDLTMLSAPLPFNPGGFVAKEKPLQEFTNKLSQVYQYALLAYVKGDDGAENINKLAKVLYRLKEITLGSKLEQLWRVASAVLEGLSSGALNKGQAINSLLWELGACIRRLSSQSIARCEESFPADLLKNLLYYITVTDPGLSPRLQQLHREFKLDEALPVGVLSITGGGFVPSYDQGVVRALASALGMELEGIKAHLSSLVDGRGESGAISEVTIPALNRVADTLAMVGQSSLRESVQELAVEIQSALSSDSNSQAERLSEIASHVLGVEAALETWASNYRLGVVVEEQYAETAYLLNEAQYSLICEVRNDLEAIKDAVVGYISSQWDTNFIQDVPALIENIEGALALARMKRPARIVSGLGDFLSKELLVSSVTPTWDRLDLLADGITAMENFLEVVTSDANRGSKELTMAEQALSALGYMDPEDQVLMTAELPQVVGAMQETVMDGLAGPLATPGVAANESVEGKTDKFNPPVSRDSDSALRGSDSALRDSDSALKDSDIDDQETEELDEIDEEIIEIFVEEAREILQGLEARYPHWLQHREDTAVLAEIRRDFHSLKGSGRMVHARHIGELGFVVEDLFNKVIDGKLVFDKRSEELMGEVLNILPALINDYEGRQQDNNGETAEALIGSFRALVHGEAAVESAVVAGMVVAGAGNASNDSPLADIPVLDVPVLDRVTPGAPELSGAAASFEEADGQPDDVDIEASDPLAANALQNARGSGEADRALINIFIEEARGHTRVLADFTGDLRSEDGLRLPPTELSGNHANTLRSLHMLKGSACVAEVEPVAQLAQVLENLIKEITRSIVRVDGELISLLQDAVASLELLIDAAANISPDLSAQGEALQRQIEEARHSHRITTRAQADILSLNAMLINGLDRLLEAPQLLDKWRVQSSDLSGKVVVELTTELLDLAGAAEGARCLSVSILAKQYAEAISAYHQGQFESDKTFRVFHQAYECLLDMIDAFVAEQTIHPAPESLLSALIEIVRSSRAADSIAAAETVLVDTDIDHAAAEEETGLQSADADLATGSVDTAYVDTARDGGETPDAETGEEEFTEAEALEPMRDQPVVNQPELIESGVLESEPDAVIVGANEEDIDLDVVALFIEEAEELLERIEEAIQAWRETPGDTGRYHETLIRELHTFKGGARVAGFGTLGDRSHDFETFIESQAGLPGDKPAGFFDELLKRYDELAGLLEQASVRTSADIPSLSPPSPTQALPGDAQDRSAAYPSPDDQGVYQQRADAELLVGKQATQGAQDAPSPHRLAAVKNNLQSVERGVKPEPGSPVTDTGDYRRVVEPPVAPVSRSIPVEAQEMVKISATAVDELVNLAGETSVTRGRIEQNINEFTLSLDEMEATVVRLQEQVRRMGMETEAQILFRREQIESSDESNDFDPLELDRYSQFQHLFSALQESASDLQEVKETLISNTRSAELSLSQQSQVTTDLQESLMLTRLVPFTRLVPRLRRVVRQASNELNKSVALQLNNVDGDLDRTVLGKIVGPLEHMIRNAVDHGVEDSETRQLLGKPAEGMISLSYGRESNEITIRVADDGKGLDVAAIRNRAESRGLIAEGARVADQELLQLIFLPGFSTSDTLSQISGRGVGLDVVVNEVRQLGGSVSVLSEPGSGTEFNIRVPFTLSVNRALMVHSRNERYALPLNSIVGVVQMTGAELAERNADPAKKLYYGGEGYRICLLSQLLGEQGGGQTLATEGKVGLVLVASENYRFAVQVESMEGSQEIAIKSLGTMFNRVAGLSGVTLMGDGRVVVILDLVTLLRAQGAMDSPVLDGQLMRCELAEPEYSSGRELVNVEGGASGELIELRGQRTKTVMVVDDSVTVRKVTTRFLEREGFAVLTAKDGVDAVDMLNEASPDLMLLDIEMPRMDGFDVARVVRNNPRLGGLPIVMISSRSGTKHRDKAAACGVNYFLGKPYREDELLELITDMLGT